MRALKRSNFGGEMYAAAVKSLPDLPQPFTPAQLWMATQRRMGQLTERQRLKGLGSAISELRLRGLIELAGPGRYVRRVKP